MPLHQDMVEVKPGKVIDFYLLAMGPAVMVFPFTKEKKLVLIRQYKHGTGAVIIEGPAGMIEQGQTPTAAAVRELEEEAGIKFQESKLIDLGNHSQSPTKNTHTLQGFLALDVEFNSQQDLDDTENIEVIQVTPKEAIEMILSGEIWASDTVAFILKIKLRYPELF